MLQDEVVRTWSGDFQKSSQHQKIKQLNSREMCVWADRAAFGSWPLVLGLVNPEAAAEQIPRVLFGC
jgi:hypothetical protein